MNATTAEVATNFVAVAEAQASDQDLSLVRELSALELSLVGGGFVNANFA